jgi:hypothetical protein
MVGVDTKSAWPLVLAPRVRVATTEARHVEPAVERKLRVWPEKEETRQTRDDNDGWNS